MASVPIQPKDSRGYFLLPQAPSQAQYAHPNLLTFIFQIEREWQALCDRKFGIGNISIDGGRGFDRHRTHRKGIEMDCRPVRKDRMAGQAARCSYQDSRVYDREATIKLLGLFVAHPWIRIVYFNDPEVQRALGARVKSAPGHADHFHVELQLRYAS